MEVENMEKAIFLYRCDFTDEQWENICDEFEADYNAISISCIIDLSSVSQDFKRVFYGD